MQGKGVRSVTLANGAWDELVLFFCSIGSCPVPRGWSRTSCLTWYC